MGIKGLSAFMKKFAKEVKLDDFANKSFAIDASIYLYKYKYGTKTTAQFLKKFEYQLSSFERINIKPIYIFDGVSPVEKMITKQKRRDKKTETSITITKEDTELVKNLFQTNFVQYYTAPAEAEKLCSFMNYKGLVDVVLSNDTDTFLYETKTLLTLSKTGFLCYNLQEIKDQMNIKTENFIDLGIASGCDYFDGIPGIGPSKAYNHIKKSGKIENWKVTFPENMNLQRLRQLFNDYTIEEEFINSMEIFEKESVTSISSKSSLISLDDLEIRSTDEVDLGDDLGDDLEEKK